MQKHIRTNTVVVGSGAAGLAAACRLHDLGVPVCLVTEGMEMGASRNTGSDKQTYSRLSLLDGDSVEQMAADLFAGGAVDGDLALVEAALSVPCFCRLCDIGVPFPHNAYGEYTGYRTDHAERLRATSAGPLTSKFMTECWQRELERRGVPVYDRQLAVRIVTTPDGGSAAGLITLSTDCDAPSFTLFACQNLVWATGGPAGVYADSVYPVSQTGGTGVALAAGAAAKNLTEWQYGLASLGTEGHEKRWNLSGSYQQVLPSYVSVDANGAKHDFLRAAFDTPEALWLAVFRKGYEWPFDPRKVGGSSRIDLLVYRETQLRGRRVYLDYTRNPLGKDFSFDRLPPEAREYLARSGAEQATPIERLRAMNPPAVELYASAGIDLARDRLEIALCAQHCNGGLASDCWFESELGHFFPIGEANGSHGITRPGGAALNAGQVGAARAAERIAHCYTGLPDAETFAVLAAPHLEWAETFAKRLLSHVSDTSSVHALRRQYGQCMSRYAAQLRTAAGLDEAAQALTAWQARFFDQTRLGSARELPDAFRNYDLLLTQRAMVAAMRDYLARGGRSRGGCLVGDPAGAAPAGLPEPCFRHSLDDGALAAQVQELRLRNNQPTIRWRPVRPIPTRTHWFEQVWAAYRSGEVYKMESSIG